MDLFHLIKINNSYFIKINNLHLYFIWTYKNLPNFVFFIFILCDCKLCQFGLLCAIKNLIKSNQIYISHICVIVFTKKYIKTEESTLFDNKTKPKP